MSDTAFDPASLTQLDEPVRWLVELAIARGV